MRYVFRNRTPRDMRIIVAFPMPDYDLAEPMEGDVVWPVGFRDPRRRPPGPDRGRAPRRRSAASTRPTCWSGSACRSSIRATTRARGGRLGRLQLLPDDGQSRLLAAGLVRAVPAAPATRAARAALDGQGDLALGPGLPGRARRRRSSIATGPAPAAPSAPPSPCRSYRQSEDGRARIARYCMDDAFLGAVDRIARARGHRITRQSRKSG